MKELLLELSAAPLPKYRRLAQALRAAVRAGRLRPGETLPSSRDLARRFGFNRHTVMAALAELAAEGWVEAEEKRHYRVTATLPDTFLRPKFAVPAAPAGKTAVRLARRLSLPDYQDPSSARYAFPSGTADFRLFPLRELRSHLHDSLRTRRVLSYGDPRGMPSLRQEIENYLRRVRGIEGREVLVTNGSQEAIFLLAQLLVAPGSTVAVEALGYPPALEALRFAGAQLVPVRVDEAGLDVDHLAQILRRRRVRLLYLTPLHQYPTTVTLSAERRLRLYELAQKHGFLILEDDYDHEFHYRSQPVAPLASFDPEGLVAYVSTFSKVLFPSARLGFLAVPPALAKEAAKLKRISSRQNESVLQDAVARWMGEGGFERHLRRMRRTYAERLDGVLATLTVGAASNPRLRWRPPDGGMALWLDIGRDAGKAAAAAARAGVLVQPEGHYRLDGKAGTHLRLGFTGQTVPENAAGLRALFGAIS